MNGCSHRGALGGHAAQGKPLDIMSRAAPTGRDICETNDLAGYAGTAAGTSASRWARWPMSTRRPRRPKRRSEAVGPRRPSMPLHSRRDRGARRRTAAALAPAVPWWLGPFRACRHRVSHCPGDRRGDPGGGGASRHFQPRAAAARWPSSHSIVQGRPLHRHAGRWARALQPCTARPEPFPFFGELGRQPHVPAGSRAGGPGKRSPTALAEC